MKIMGSNDHIGNSEISNLPPEAFSNGFDVDGPIDFDNQWLKDADSDDQLLAIREWFLARYCDPADETPYNGREGGYLYIHGGPFDPADKIPDRFSGIVDDELINEVIDDFYMEVGDAWAPRNLEPDYDDYLLFDLNDRDQPTNSFSKRMGEIDQITHLSSRPDANSVAPLLIQMAFSSIIFAIEAYLAETVSFWVKNDETALRGAVSKIFKGEKISLSNIFELMDSIKVDELKHLNNQVWHRLDVLKPVIESSLDIDLPDIEALMKAIEVRHDIVHRSGKTKDGDDVIITSKEVQDLKIKAEEFVNAIEAELNINFPRNPKSEKY